MSRAVRITLWIVGSIILLSGLTVLWIDTELKPEPLGKRVASLLTESKITGGIKKVQASFDGSFLAENADLTLEDGTQVKFALVQGKADLLASLFGKYTLKEIEVKGLEINLSRKQIQPPTKSKETISQPAIPLFAIGPYGVTGRIILSDSQVIRFSARGEGIDSSGSVDLRAGLAWPGFNVGNTPTTPRGEIILKAELQRPLGKSGLSLTSLLSDVKNCRLNILAKDESPIAAGSMSLDLEGQRNVEGVLVLNGNIRDASQKIAAQVLTQAEESKIRAEADLNLDPQRFGILSADLPPLGIKGKLSATLEPAKEEWTVKTDLILQWMKSPPTMRVALPATSSKWILQSEIQKTKERLNFSQFNLSGNGIKLSLTKPWQWQPEKPLDDLTFGLIAQEVEMTSLNPLLSLGQMTATSGRWTGEAEIQFRNGEPQIKTLKTHRISGLSLQKDGKPLLQEVDLEIPLSSKAKSICLSPFRIQSSTGTIAEGEATLSLQTDNSWKLSSSIDLGLAELFSQPGWQDLPKDKVKGVRLFARFDASSEKNQSPVIQKLEATIKQNSQNLLNVKLRQPYTWEGSKPTGVVIEATAEKLPLESLSALIPHLKISGTLEKADIVAGFKTEGWFIRTEGAPLSFRDTSVQWKEKSWINQCDFSTQLELLFGEKTTQLQFQQATLSNRLRVLASGNVEAGLGNSPTRLQLQGNLGALAEQPFVSFLSNISTGNYRAQGEISTSGDSQGNLTITDLSFKDRVAKVKSLTLEGNYSSNETGKAANLLCQLDGMGRTRGKLAVTQKIEGALNDWKIQCDFENLYWDDISGFISQSDGETRPLPKNTQPDRVPFWQNHQGSLVLNLEKVTAKSFSAENLNLKAEATPETITLSSLQGKFAQGTLGGSGKLSFQPSLLGGPYLLNSKLTLTQFDFGAVAASFPALKEFIQGKGDAYVTAEGLAINLDQLIDRINLQAGATSKGGQIQAFGSQQGTMALSANQAATTAETIGNIALIAGALTKNQKQADLITKAATAMKAGAKLQQSLAQFNYDLADIELQRLPDGTIKIKKGLVKNAQLHLSASGQITSYPQMKLADWPLSIKAEMRGSRPYADYFTLLGFADDAPSTDGLTQGPSVQFSGSLNDLRNDLAQRLQSAVNRIKSGENYRNQNPTQGTPTGPSPRNIVPTEANPFEIILGR